MTPKTFNKVWNFNVGTGINAPAVSYSVNGKQYIAVSGRLAAVAVRHAERSVAEIYLDDVDAVRVRA